MQSHATRHIVSEALADRHPYVDPPFEKEPRPDEVAEAYGDRQIPKLVGVLRLSEERLPESERIHCLRLFSNLLSTQVRAATPEQSDDSNGSGAVEQETKVKAITADALPPLIGWLRNPSSSTAVRQVCCRSLASLCQLQQGRAAFAAAGGVPVLTDALATTPDAAVAAMRVLAGCADGVATLHASPARVTGALVDVIGHPSSSWAAATEAATCLTGLCNCDEGVIEALACQVPRTLQQLAIRCLRFTKPIPTKSLADGGDEHRETNGSPDAGAALLPQLLEALRAVAATLLVVSHHMEGKTQLREADCIPVLTSMLAVADSQVQGSAAACLASMTIEVDSKVAVMEAAGPALIQLVKEGKQVIATAARTVLLCAAEHLDARRKLELMLKPGELKELLGVLPQVPPDYKYVVWTAEPTPTTWDASNDPGHGAAV